MNTPILESHRMPGDQLLMDIYEDHIACTMYDVRKSGSETYLEYIKLIGITLQKLNTGKVLADISQMRNYDIGIRAAAVNNLNELLLTKAPYFLLAVVKGNSLFENLSMQTAISVSKPLSKKFLDGKLFENRQEAMEWLINYSMPAQFQKA